MTDRIYGSILLFCCGHVAWGMQLWLQKHSKLLNRALLFLSSVRLVLRRITKIFHGSNRKCAYFRWSLTCIQLLCRTCLKNIRKQEAVFLASCLSNSSLGWKAWIFWSSLWFQQVGSSRQHGMCGKHGWLNLPAQTVINYWKQMYMYS